MKLSQGTSLIVTRDNNREVNPEMVMPALIRDNSPVSGLGTVSEIPGGAIVQQNFENTISWGYTNTTGNAVQLVLFDPTGIVANQLGITGEDPLTSNIATLATIWNAYLLTRQYLFKGFNYTVSNAVAQLGLDITIATASASGVNSTRLTPSSFQRNTAQNPNLLTFAGNILITPNHAVIVTVPDTLSVNFDFYGGTLFDGFATVQR